MKRILSIPLVALLLAGCMAAPRESALTRIDGSSVSIEQLEAGIAGLVDESGVPDLPLAVINDSEIICAGFLIAVMDGTGLSEQAHAQMLAFGRPMKHAMMFGPSRFERSDAFSHVSWGLGVGLVRTGHGNGLFHTVHDDPCVNYAIAYPDKRIGIAIMGNDVEVERIIPAITRLAIGDEGSPFPFLGYPEPIVLPNN